MRTFWLVLGSAVLTLGGLFLAAGIFLPMTFGRLLVGRSVRRLRTSTCADLVTSRRLPRRAGVSGRTDAGPAGELVAPMSHEQVVWYRVRIWRDDYARTNDGSDTQVWEYESSDRVAVEDRTGRVYVSSRLLDRPLLGEEPPGLLEFPFAERSAGSYEDQLRTLHAAGLVSQKFLGRLLKDSYGHSVEEAVVYAGRKVTAFGTPSRDAGGAVLKRIILGRSGVSLDRLPAVRSKVADKAEGDLWWFPYVGGMVGAALVLLSMALLSLR